MYSIKTGLATAAGPFLGAICAFLMSGSGFPVAACWTAGITVWVAVWWTLEPIPIPVTSLIPLALLPALGVLTPTQVATAYGNPVILLLLGGFLLSTAMEKTGVHRRLALNLINVFGAHSPRRLIAGFTVSAAILSMWISNTATTLMLLPIGMAVLAGIDNQRIRVGLLLGIAYGASVGGVGSPIGTPPNLIFMDVYGETIGEPPSFTAWMRWGVPVATLMIPCIVIWLSRGLPRRSEVTLPDVGAWRIEEKRCLWVFGITALLWMTRQEPFGGWTSWPLFANANDASVAFVAVIAMFLISDGKQGRLLDWPTAVKIPWGVLLLFSGGITIARAFVESGLSEVIAGQISLISALPPLLMIWLICVSVTFLTEITSNTATTTLLMPILAAVAIGAEIDPLVLMLPAVISASFAFMLPVATAPNAVIFGSNEFSVKTMMKEGLALNLLGSLIVSTVLYLILI